MATNFASARRNGSMAAARLHVELGSRARMETQGGSVDVFDAISAIRLPLLLRPLNGLLGAYLPQPIPGVLITTERPLSIQRLTAAHELGHFRLGHLPSLDDESVLRRMAMPNARRFAGPNLQEIEADAFAAAFLMPRWLVEWHCLRQEWLAHDLLRPLVIYQLSLRLGASYEAMTWVLQRLNFISASAGNSLRLTRPREIKAELLREYRPINYRGDVWLLTERDSNTRIYGSRNDHFVLHLTESSGGGYLWDMDQLRKSGFAIVGDSVESVDDESVGGPTRRNVTAAPEQGQRGALSLIETRPWQPDSPINELRLRFDLTGPEEVGLSRAERRRAVEAA